MVEIPTAMTWCPNCAACRASFANSHAFTSLCAFVDSGVSSPPLAYNWRVKSFNEGRDEQMKSDTCMSVEDLNAIECWMLYNNAGRSLPDYPISSQNVRWRAI
jgi:hypothetical protein